MLIAVNVLIFSYLYFGDKLIPTVTTYGVRPADFFQLANYSTIGLTSLGVSIFASMFLHAGWVHILGNTLFLWIFGDNVEDRLGHLKYLLFYLLCGLGATAAHIITNPTSRAPSIGASGAISGILGGYLLMFPNARILTLVPLFIFFTVVELPALLFIGIWFIYQFLFGMATLPMALVGGGRGGGIAWFAHIGGFVVGLLLIRVLIGKHYR